MRSMTKSALRVARDAPAAGEAALPPYGGRCSRRDYTQPQLFALLTLRQFRRAGYRGVVALAAEWRASCARRRASAGCPTTRRWPTRRPASWPAPKRGHVPPRPGRADRARPCCGPLGGEPAVAAVDAAGLEARHVSAHFGLRRAGSGHRQRAWPKLTAVVDAASHLIVGAVPASDRARTCRLRPRGSAGGGAGRVRRGPRRRGLRRGAQPPALPRGTRHPAGRDRAQPAQRGRSVARRAVSARDASRLPGPDLPATLARGERFQPAQAAPRLGPDRPRRRRSGRGARPPRPDPRSRPARHPDVRVSTKQ